MTPYQIAGTVLIIMFALVVTIGLIMDYRNWK